jgi:sulfate adenylyltransferase subunit 1
VARDSGAGGGHQARTISRIAHGRAPGDSVQLFPGQQTALVQELRHAGRRVEVAHAGQSAGLVLDRQLDVSRGDWAATPGGFTESRRFGATLAWLDTEAAQVGRRYWVRHGNRWVQARIASIDSRLDIHTLQPAEAHALAVNEIGRVTIELQQALPLQLTSNRVGGS